MKKTIRVGVCVKLEIESTDKFLQEMRKKNHMILLGMSSGQLDGSD